MLTKPNNSRKSKKRLRDESKRLQLKLKEEEFRKSKRLLRQSVEESKKNEKLMMLNIDESYSKRKNKLTKIEKLLSESVFKQNPSKQKL